MADNYLERRMEDLRAGKLAPRRPRRVRRELDGRSFYVPDGTSDSGRTLVEELRRKGAQVAFSGLDTERGNATAAVYGARYIPADPESEAEIKSVHDALSSHGNFVILKNDFSK